MAIKKNQFYRSFLRHVLLYIGLSGLGMMTGGCSNSNEGAPPSPGAVAQFKTKPQPGTNPSAMGKGAMPGKGPPP